MSELSREEYDRFRSCLSKEKFADVVAARRHARAALKNIKTVLTPYSCRFCDGYHLTSQSRDKQKKQLRSKEGHGHGAP